ELGQITQRGVEQAPDGVAGLGGDGFRGMAEQCRQRHNCQYGQHEEQGGWVRLTRLNDEDDGHEDKQPEQWVVTDLSQERIHVPAARRLVAADVVRPEYSPTKKRRSGLKSAPAVSRCYFRRRRPDRSIATLFST